MILDEIVRNTRAELDARKKTLPFAELRKKTEALGPKKPRFLEALRANKNFAVIAEIKRRSPSKGTLREDFDAPAIAREYEAAGAAALSILTDEKFFGGSAETFAAVRAATGLPLLRKDFMLEEYHIWESRLMGADCVLLIADVLSDAELASLSSAAKSLGLDALVEVHSQRDAEKARRLGPALVGVNNRDLRTFWVDIKVTERLLPELPPSAFVVSESGIQRNEDLLYLRALGVRGALVGESLMREPSPGKALKTLLGGFDAR